MTSQANLASRLAPAQQDSGRQIESLRTGQLLQCGPGNHLRLVESALGLLALVQGHGNHQNFPTGHHLFQIGNDFRQHMAENYGSGSNLLELKQMNQVAQSAVVATASNRPLKWRIRPLAEQTPRLRIIQHTTLRRSAIKIRRCVQRLTANGAVRPLQRF
jgi:hypothetical protein